MDISASSRAWSRLRRDRLAWISSGIIALLVLAGFFGPEITGDSGPNAITPATFVQPSLAHLLGTDELGRNVLTQLLYGIRTSLTVGLSAALAAGMIGVTIGALAGFAGGWLDTAIMRAAEVFQVMPTFILASVIVAFAGPGTLRIILVIAILSWPQTARLMRSEVLRVKALEFIDALRCLGVREQSILWLEVVPNAIAPALALGTLIIGQAILLEASLAFFGLTSPDVPSWGQMLNSGQRFFYQAWWLSVFPGVAILLTVLSFNVLGDRVSDAFSPRATLRK
jgi:peptide/nickel transport system permease protein